MTKLLECPECFCVIPAARQAMHEAWHDDQGDPVSEVTISAWPASNLAGEDFRPNSSVTPWETGA